MQWRGKKVLFLLVIVLTIIPFEAVALPLYFMFSGQRDTILIQAIPFIANAFSIFLFYTFFLDVPGEIEEAARLDGAGPFRTFFQVVVPITKPAFATVAILTFLAQWGSYLWPVLMVSDPTVRPLPLAISIFQNQQPPEWGQVLAFGTMFIVPVLAVFLIFQRWFVPASAAPPSRANNLPRRPERPPTNRKGVVNWFSVSKTHGCGTSGSPTTAPRSTCTISMHPRASEIRRSGTATPGSGTPPRRT